MVAEQIFVGAIAMAIGAAAFVAAAVNWESCFQLPKLQWIERRYGRGGARWFCGLLGVTFMMLGAAIAAGFRLRP